jgi:hypothetical protein
MQKSSPEKQRKLVISLCDLTGNMIIPWIRAGYDCVCVDIQHDKEDRQVFEDGNTLTKIKEDIFNYILPQDRKIKMIFAFPPCTHLSVSGARWMKQKGLKSLIEALRLVERCRELCEDSHAPYMIENPVSTLSTYWRKPDYKFDPCDYAGYCDPPVDLYTKKTCLWTGNGFIMPPPKRMEPIQGSKMHLMGPSPERANLRAATPKGFAEAVFQANELGNG